MRPFLAFNVCQSFMYMKLVAVGVCHSSLVIIISCRLPVITKEKLTKWRKTLFFSVYAVPIFVYQKQTYDDKYVDFSRLFQKIHKFSCVLVYIWIRKNHTVCSQGTINFVYFFPNFCLKRKIQLWIKMHLAFRVSTRMQNKRTSAQTGQRPCILH